MRNYKIAINVQRTGSLFQKMQIICDDITISDGTINIWRNDTISLTIDKSIFKLKYGHIQNSKYAGIVKHYCMDI